MTSNSRQLFSYQIKIINNLLSKLFSNLDNTCKKTHIKPCTVKETNLKTMDLFCSKSYKSKRLTMHDLCVVVVSSFSLTIKSKSHIFGYFQI
jgi:hypothetical protein